MDKISYALMLVPIPCVQVAAVGFKALRLAGKLFSKMASRGSREAIKATFKQVVHSSELANIIQQPG